ncbi:MAG TPA: peptide ABC transporter substrate-binding protein [Gemmatimonadaceae bacterium]|nr:peptide ABC transporter substrate-binding protein [Gemmatimonadaceae bacterium]
MRIPSRLGVAMLAATVACTSPENGATVGDVGGTLVIALPAEPRSVLPPFLSGSQEREISEQLFDVLADIGPDLNTIGDVGWKPRLAESWQWSADSMSIAFKLDPRAHWHDGRRITSADVRFSVELNKDPVTVSRLARALADVDSVSTPDSVTAIVWYSKRSPEQFYNVAYNLALLPAHLLRDADRSSLQSHPFARNPVGSGPFRFSRWEPASLFEVIADTSYYLGRPLLNRVIWVLHTDPNTALETVIAGDADVFESMTTDGMARVAGHELVRAVPYPTLNYGFLGFNLRDRNNGDRPHPLFADRELRRAIAMALNRPLLVANVYDSLAQVGAGPFSREFPTADTTLRSVAFDSVGADRLLDSLGWNDGNGDGVREKGGRALRFGIVFPTTSPQRRRLSELIQAQLKSHGIQVDVEAADLTVFGPRLFTGKFDAMLHNWALEPSPSRVRDHWHTFPASSRALNLQLYSNPVVDAALDSAIAEHDTARSRALYRKAYQAITDDLPAVWLFENKAYMAIHNRVQANLSAPDVWWRNLRLWSIPASKRIPRDG